MTPCPRRPSSSSWSRTTRPTPGWSSANSARPGSPPTPSGWRPRPSSWPRLDTAPDVVLCDYNLPQFDALRALEVLRERWPDVPFLIVSGSIGEETAVEAIKHGAADYLLKDRLGRLGPAVRQALEERSLREAERRGREALRASEEQYRVAGRQHPPRRLDGPRRRPPRLPEPAGARLLRRRDGRTDRPRLAEALSTRTTCRSPGRRGRRRSGPGSRASSSSASAGRTGPTAGTSTGRWRSATRPGPWSAGSAPAPTSTTRRRPRPASPATPSSWPASATPSSSPTSAGVVTYWNEGAARLFGWTADEMLGRPYADRFPEPFRAGLVEQIRLRAGGSEWNGEYEDWCKDGTRVWIHARVSRLTDAAGRPIGHPRPGHTTSPAASGPRPSATACWSGSASRSSGCRSATSSSTPGPAHRRLEPGRRADLRLPQGRSPRHGAAVREDHTGRDPQDDGRRDRPHPRRRHGRPFRQRERDAGRPHHHVRVVEHAHSWTATAPSRGSSPWSRT